jgi:hypothetical protein
VHVVQAQHLKRIQELLRLSLSIPTQTHIKVFTSTMAESTEPTTMEPTPAQLQAQLEQLKASATQQYSLKNYSAAAEFYSEAAEVQDKVNGEMSPDNSDLLYQYGRCLYHLGVSKSDVLGGKVAGNNNGSEEPKRKKRKTAAPAAESSAAGADKAIADALKNGEQKLVGVEEEKEEEEDGKALANPFSRSQATRTGLILKRRKKTTAKTRAKARKKRKKTTTSPSHTRSWTSRASCSAAS